MSSKLFTARRIVAGIAAALAVAGGALVLSGGNVTANYSAKAPVVLHADAGKLQLTATGTVSAGKLIPGRPQSSTVTFTNPGNVAGDTLTIGMPVSVQSWTVPAGQTPDWSQVYVSVPGSVNLDTPTPVTSAPTQVQLGGIAAGGARNVTFVIELRSAGNNAAGDAKDNQFQGVSVDATATAVLRTN